MTTENEKIETPINDAPEATAERHDEIAELQRQLKAIQADRAGMAAKLEEIAERSERIKAANAAPSVQPAAPVAADAFVKRKATTLDGVEADALAEQQTVVDEVKALSARSAKIKAEQSEVEAALFASENRVKVLSSPNRGEYVSARAELAAKALMGETVDLSAVPAHDVAESMSVSDVHAGIVALKKRRDTLSGEFDSIRRGFIAQGLKYCQLHGVVQACRFIKAKRQLMEAAAGVMAAQERTLGFYDNGHVLRSGVNFFPLHFEGDFNIPAFTDIGSLPEVRGYDNSRVNCEMLRTSGKVRAAVDALNIAMNGGAA